MKLRFCLLISSHFSNCPKFSIEYYFSHSIFKFRKTRVNTLFESSAIKKNILYQKSFQFFTCLLWVFLMLEHYYLRKKRKIAQKIWKLWWILLYVESNKAFCEDVLNFNETSNEITSTKQDNCSKSRIIPYFLKSSRIFFSFDSLLFERRSRKLWRSLLQK